MKLDVLNNEDVFMFEGLPSKARLFFGKGLVAQELVEGSCAYYSDEMLNNNVVIYEDVNYIEPDNVETVIRVEHYNDEDAGSWCLYEGPLLSGIQIYRIVMDVYEIYQNNSLYMFLRNVDGLCEHSFFAASQTIEKYRSETMERIKGDIEDVRSSNAVS